MAEAKEKTAPAKSGSRGWMLFCVVALLAAGAGAALPWLVWHHPEKSDGEKKEAKTVLIPFGDAVVNLGEERLTRYLRVKIILVVDQANEKAVTALLSDKKAFLKNWLISHLSDQSIQEMRGGAGVNRIRREVRDQFNAMLFADGSEKINDILFDEFMVQ